MPYTGHPEKTYSTGFWVIPEQGNPYEDTPEDYLRSIRSKKATGYVIKTTTCGRWRECEMYPMWKSSRDVPRAADHNPTSTVQQDLNDRNAQRNFARLIAENFIEGRDWWLSLTVDNLHLPITEEQAAKQMTNYLERIRYAFVKAGGKSKDFKYAYVVEWKKGRDSYRRYILDTDGSHIMRPHWHVIIMGGSGITSALLRRQWQLGKRVRVEPLLPDETGYHGTAKYLSKSLRGGRRRYATSNNLRRPQQTVAMCHKMGSKRRVQQIAACENDRPAFFEKLYKGEYRFVDCKALYNEVNDGVYLYCRMERKREGQVANPKTWGYGALWEE